MYAVDNYEILLSNLGVKAHFRMDESGIIQLERVESLFEKTVNEEETPKADDPSTLDQIKNAFNNMWGDDKKEGEKAEEQEKPETDNEEKNEESKEDPKEEKKEEGKEEKKDEKAEEKEEKKEEKEEKTEEKKAEEPAGDKDGKEEAESEEKKAEEASAAPKEEKKLVPKQVTVKEPIDSTTIYSDIKALSAESIKTAKVTLKKLEDADEERVKREAAQNSLETFIYDTKDKLNNDEFGSCATGEFGR